MIHYDPTSPMVLGVDSDATDDVLEALTAGAQFEGSHQLDARLVTMAHQILSDPRGSLTLELSGDPLYHRHEIVLSRAGALRRSRASARRDEIAVFLTPILPGVMMRLLGLAPVEPLDDEHRLAAPPEVLDRLWTTDDEERSRGWAEMRRIARALPTAEDPELEDAPVRALRVSRQDRTFEALMLRGRYLRVERGALSTTLVGSDPTGISRTIFALLTPRR